MSEPLIPHSEHANEIVGANIQRARLNRGITLEALSEETGLSVELLKSYEDGTEAIIVSDVYRIAVGMKAPLTAFWKGEEVTVDAD
ncbi:hypothetical protein [Aureimonas sp. SK2]|uniref:helix-turn-helix domain-containing protein n=1 Tax=Aureimonas sp. SK2 TaxID=3015992 RepID=UPI002443FDB4|nr:hypothetical protein [Aureimonas sp. SK2]